MGHRPIQIVISPRLTPLIEVFLSILESSRHELRITHGLIFMTPSLRGWETFPTPGALTHTRITWAFSPSGATSLGCHSGVPLVHMMFRASLLERCATWEVFLTPGALTDIRNTWALSPISPHVPGVIPGSPLCPWYLGHISWRGVRHVS